MVNNNNILQLVQHIIENRELILSTDSTKFIQRECYGYIDRNVNSSSIYFRDSKFDFRLSINFTNIPTSTAIKDTVDKQSKFLLFTSNNDVIDICGNLVSFDSSPECMFGLSTVLSSLEYQYYSLVKLFRDIDIDNNTIIIICKRIDLDVPDRTFEIFHNIFDKLLLGE